MTEVRFSVVIPLYNKERYIDRAVQSVLNQTVDSWELIIVDDGSTDKSVECVSKYINNKIHLIQQKNLGPAVARNVGITSAVGDFVAFLDADDYWNCDFLDTIVKLIVMFPNAGMYGTARAVYSDEKFLWDVTWKPELGNRILPSYFQDTIEAQYTIINMSSSVMPKKVLSYIGMFSEMYRSGQDLDIFGKIALHYPIAYSPKICTYYTSAAENNMDRSKIVRYVPLTFYLDSFSDEEKRKQLSRIDLVAYLDYYNLKIGAHNIYIGFRDIGRKQLLEVKSQKYNLKKYIFILLSYIPIPLSCVSGRFARKIGKKLKLAG